VGGTLRELAELFPGLSEEHRREAFAEGGLIISHGRGWSPVLSPMPEAGIGLPAAISRHNPAFLTESILILPHSGRPFSNLDAYNALGRIENLAGRLYHSYTRDSLIPLFEEATRLSGGDRRSTPIPDPPPAGTLPTSETIYIRLRDANFGNSFYRADFSLGPHGVTYRLTNNRNLTYLFVPVMREERFNAYLYLEPIAEGMLIYSVAGGDASDFIANRIDLPSAISKRLEVFIGWVIDGLETFR
jgi:hypothetical protein